MATDRLGQHFVAFVKENGRLWELEGSRVSKLPLLPSFLRRLLRPFPFLQYLSLPWNSTKVTEKIERANRPGSAQPRRRRPELEGDRVGHRQDHQDGER
jgi:hypothetical protein